MAASYFPPGPPPELRARVEAVEAYLAEHHLASVTWHFTLNNHASTRPKANGGPLVRAVTPCKTFTHVAPGSAVGAAVGAGSWRCSLDLPNSFTPTDGRRLQTEGYGSTKTEASEHACRRAVAHLLMTEPSQVILRPAHWRIPPSALLEGLPGTETVHQAQPVHVPARSLEAGVEAATLTAAEVDYQVADLLRRCLNAHGGSFDPSRISRAALGQGPGEEQQTADQQPDQQLHQQPEQKPHLHRHRQAEDITPQPPTTPPTEQQRKQQRQEDQLHSQQQQQQQQQQQCDQQLHRPRADCIRSETVRPLAQSGTEAVRPLAQRQPKLVPTPKWPARPPTPTGACLPLDVQVHLQHQMMREQWRQQWQQQLLQQHVQNQQQQLQLMQNQQQQLREEQMASSSSSRGSAKAPELFVLRPTIAAERRTRQKKTEKGAAKLKAYEAKKKDVRKLRRLFD